MEWVLGLSTDDLALQSAALDRVESVHEDQDCPSVELSLDSKWLDFLQSTEVGTQAADLATELAGLPSLAAGLASSLVGNRLVLVDCHG